MVLMNLFAGHQWRNRQTERTDLWTWGGGGVGGMYGTSSMETDITICKIDSQWGFAICLRKLKQGLCINLEGWDGEGNRREFQEGGTYVYLRLIHVDV